jgi:hypothetical protein
MNPLWLQEVLEKLEQGSEEDAIEHLTTTLDDILLLGWYAELDEHLQQIEVENTPSILLVTILSTTLETAPWLPSRPDLYRRTREAIQLRREYEPEILGELEYTLIC